MKTPFAVNNVSKFFLLFIGLLTAKRVIFMVWLIRAGVYLLSGFTIWQFVQNPGAGSGDLSGHLSLDQANGMVFGVCAGLSNYTGIDVSLIRLVFALAAFYRGLGIIIYILVFLIVPVS